VLEREAASHSTMKNAMAAMSIEQARMRRPPAVAW
jgi:hypothetical protein